MSVRVRSPVNDGDAENTTLPEPVSSVNTDAKLEELGVAKNVATFDARHTRTYW